MESWADELMVMMDLTGMLWNIWNHILQRLMIDMDKVRLNLKMKITHDVHGAELRCLNVLRDEMIL